MKDLKLGMPILATTTCYLDNEIFKLHPTTLEDAYTSDRGGELRIMLGNGHWGACPSRLRKGVCINNEEVKALATSRLEKNLLDVKEGKELFFVSVNNTHSITIKSLRFSREVNSLKEGSFKEFSSGYESMKIFDDVLPTNFFYSLEDAIDYFAETSKRFLS